MEIVRTSSFWRDLKDILDYFHDVSDPVFYYCFGLYKIAVIIQQIYARYIRGHTQDVRLATLANLVHVLSQQGDRALEAGRL